MPLWRKVDRLRPLDEAAAYARCHGDRDDSVRVVTLPPRRARYDTLLATGEEIRRASRRGSTAATPTPVSLRAVPDCLTSALSRAGASLHSVAARPIRLVA